METETRALPSGAIWGRWEERRQRCDKLRATPCEPGPLLGLPPTPPAAGVAAVVRVVFCFFSLRSESLRPEQRSAAEQRTPPQCSHVLTTPPGHGLKCRCQAATRASRASASRLRASHLSKDASLSVVSGVPLFFRQGIADLIISHLGLPRHICSAVPLWMEATPSFRPQSPISALAPPQTVDAVS